MAEEEKKSAEDMLVEMINRASQRAASSAVDTAIKNLPPPSPETPPRRILSPLEEEKFQDEYQLAAASGDGKKMLKMIREGAIDPGMGMVQFVAENQGKQNVRRIEEQFGEKFTKRKPLFESLMRKYGRSYMDLADPDLASTLWKLTTVEDPTFKDEEFNERMAKVEAQKEEERKKIELIPPSLAPITDFVKVESEHVKLAEKYLPREAAKRDKVLRQCAAYGVPLEAALRQVDKLITHPEECETNDYGEIVWVQIGGSSRPPAQKRA